MEKVSKCIVCQRRNADFHAPSLCGECRRALATTILSANSETIADLWKVDEQFVQRREFLLTKTRGEVVPVAERAGSVAVDEALSAPRASVAQGLLDLGHANDPLIIAAIAVLNGVSADRNRVGASALAVCFDERLAKATMLSDLRKLVG